MALLVSVALFGLLATAITAYGYGSYAKPARLLAQLDQKPDAPVSLGRIGQPKQSRLAQRIQSIGKHAPVSPGMPRRPGIRWPPPATAARAPWPSYTASS